MFLELSEIKKQRLLCALTQKQLEKLSGIPQPTIAKIEKGKTDPSYSTARKLFDALEAAKRGREKTALEMMNRKVVLIYEGKKVLDAIKAMRSGQISQMPVIDKNNHLVGSITERTVLAKIDESPGFDLEKGRIKSVMDEPFPTVSENSPASTVAHILRDSMAVLVMKKNRVEGIITKSDLLRIM
ncbi:CBS domain-containing protein [Candidatus Micrarchaeota archaeon]|nr:CBS domain-containing protein [Candidatus Micrarchaeota archaeon]